MTNYDFIDDFIDTYKSYANDYEKGRYEMGWSSQQREFAISKAREYSQLVEWLEELKTYKEYGVINKESFDKGYNKAIDDFAELCLKHKSKEEYPIMCFDEFTIKKFAEQLKGRG